MEKRYFDIVASIYTETCRTNSYLVCGGFSTDEEAMNYINENDVSEVDYYCCCKDNETAYIEIEEHDKEGNVVDVITID